MTKRLEDLVSFPKNDFEWHSFLDGYVEDAVVIREYIDNQRPTTATFSLGPIKDELSIQHSQIPDGILKLMGSWVVPKQLSNNRARSWVNPNYKHAQHYSEALVTCGCGIPVLRQSFSENEKQPAHHQEHNEDCTKIDKLDSRKRLLENRRDIIIDGYNHNQTLNSMVKRLGYSSERPYSTKQCHNLGIDIDELMLTKRRKIARTIMVLCRQYSPSVVGEIYDLDRASVAKILTKETKSNSKALYGVRRATVYAND